ncbi:hypothetical protein IQ260_06755 [Leptolyngbya cf. ectocarpi LEGE 11479]|uniref:Arginine deiminase n=1 Tax=Leptolyngbya cf. ectocarpi LEGE 11479 TaxID=1828722 RepID=A0A928X3F5_LEPEC|nr:hypothetical protein [Leptolyngbya cf. ectocarpi LEGE 11479]
MESIKKNIQDQLPASDTARSLPHQKTPSGRTKVLHMHYVRSQIEPSGKTEIEHLRFFATTAKNLGLRLEILTDESCREEIAQVLDVYKTLDYCVEVGQKPVSKWAEDSVEYLQNGQMALLRLLDDDLLEWAMKAGRRKRWQGKVSPEDLEEVLQDDHLWILLGTRVNALKTVLEHERLAQLKGQAVSHIRTYIEGGNMIAGEDAAGNSVILIGKDAIAATAHLYQLNDDDVRRLVCEDFGLDSIEQVICVEQPGQFHLDMGMLFIGNGVVIVNDSSKALKDAVEMAAMVPCLTTEKMAAKRQLQFSLEEEAVRDLEAAGIEVRREKLASEVLFYNFFNGEFVEGEDGCHYYITNGGPKEEETIFETLMVEEWQVVKKVLFSPQDVAQKSLQERGGVGCRIKGQKLKPR